MENEKRVILHLVTQRGQPYGSVRKCCERCGSAFSQSPGLMFTDSETIYESPPTGYVRCFERSKELYKTGFKIVLTASGCSLVVWDGFKGIFTGKDVVARTTTTEAAQAAVRLLSL